MAALEHYEAGALSAWTPAQRAAINAERYTKQLDHDLIESKRDEERQARADIQQQLDDARARGDNEEKERLKKKQAKLDEKYGPEYRHWEDEATKVGSLKTKEKAKKKKRETGYGEARVVSAGQVVDDFIMSWNPPIFAFLDVFGPPHIVIIPFVAAHVIYWLKAPWYLRFMTWHPMIYMIPMLSALTALKDKQKRLIWIAYFFELAVVEYCELLFYRDRTRSAVMWPRLKAILCMIGYTVVEPSSSAPVYGAVKLMKVLLRPPGPTAEEIQEKKEEKEEKAKQDEERREKREEEKKAKQKKAAQEAAKSAEHKPHHMTW